jgi:hypothetical protein
MNWWRRSLPVFEVKIAAAHDIRRSRGSPSTTTSNSLRTDRAPDPVVPCTHVTHPYEHPELFPGPRIVLRSQNGSEITLHPRGDPRFPHGVSSLTMAAIGVSCVHDWGVIPAIYVPDGGGNDRPCDPRPDELGGFCYTCRISGRRGRTVLSGEANTAEGIPPCHLGIRDRDWRVGPIRSDKGKRARCAGGRDGPHGGGLGHNEKRGPPRRFLFSFSIFWFFSFLFQIQIKPQV